MATSELSCVAGHQHFISRRSSRPRAPLPPPLNAALFYFVFIRDFVFGRGGLEAATAGTHTHDDRGRSNVAPSLSLFCPRPRCRLFMPPRLARSPFVFTVPALCSRDDGERWDDRGGGRGAGRRGAARQRRDINLYLYLSIADDSLVLEDALMMSNPLLEGLGNAKTTRNHNSSRFGKYIQVFITPNNEATIIIGARITSFLLEKVRERRQRRDQGDLPASSWIRWRRIRLNVIATLSPPDDAPHRRLLSLTRRVRRLLGAATAGLSASGARRRAARGRAQLPRPLSAPQGSDARGDRGPQGAVAVAAFVHRRRVRPPPPRSRPPAAVARSRLVVWGGRSVPTASRLGCARGTRARAPVCVVPLSRSLASRAHSPNRCVSLALALAVSLARPGPAQAHDDQGLHHRGAHG